MADTEVGHYGNTFYFNGLRGFGGRHGRAAATSLQGEARAKFGKLDAAPLEVIDVAVEKVACTDEPTTDGSRSTDDQS
jgi:hypothetical protein